MTVVIDTALVCEQVRQEDNGKLLAIGIYSSDIGLVSMPASLTITLLARVRSDMAGDSVLDFEALLNGKRKARGALTITMKKPGATWVPLQNIALLNLDENGDLVFRYKPASGAESEWKTITSLPLLHRTTPSEVTSI